MLALPDLITEAFIDLAFTAKQLIGISDTEVVHLMSSSSMCIYFVIQLGFIM